MSRSPILLRSRMDYKAAHSTLLINALVVVEHQKTMDSEDWKSRGAEPPTREAQILPARPSHRSRMLARKLTGVQPSATQDLRFINLSHPDDLHRQKEVRTEIRRHVMKDIGQRRRRPQPNATSSQATRTFSSESNGYKISQLRGAIINSVSPSQNLAMLAHFPVEADMRALELMHSVVTGPYQPFRGVWIEVALCDPGAFHVTLGNAADFLNKINGNQSVKSPEALSHFEISTRKLRQRLNNFTESISEGAIANILAHVCLTVCATFLNVSS
ncbi:hypothetical protein CBS147332_4378 [Penicillium roqueforti]|nr:hypothetical protein CBS147332_4378 [Penicillium roqueforti]KAI3118154.1 hypothetical protein CBS147331_3093 [Penicillium roqueforti]